MYDIVTKEATLHNKINDHDDRKNDNKRQEPYSTNVI